LTRVADICVRSRALSVRAIASLSLSLFSSTRRFDRHLTSDTESVVH
jgi:hypothetical protein